MGKSVRLQMVPDEGAAAILCGLLRSEGIRCFFAKSNMGQGAADGGYSYSGWREIIVDSDDLERALEVVADLEAES
jgi:Putative prokaryotic signal transducing protein